ncbi:MAG: Crp/Fnr family transcriptional regulator [Chloroflexota bacterium]
MCYTLSVEPAARVQVLRGSLIFSALTDAELGQLSRIAMERKLNPGEFVFWDGDEGDWFYIVAEGQIKVLKHSSSGKEFIIAFFGPGEMFGDVAVFENAPYPASAQAVAETTVLGIRRESFLTLLGTHPEVALRIMYVLSGRLRDAQGRLRDIAGERVERRVARLLLMLSSRLGSELPFTRQEIADMAGTTTETAIRVMSRLRRRGVIRSTRGKVVILDRDRLSAMSDDASQA